LDLKLLLKNVYHQNVELESHVKMVESNKRVKEADFDRITMEKKVVLNNRSGKLEAFAGSTFSGKITNKLMTMQSQIPDYEKGVKERETPIESLVKKFERNGYTVE
jgi:hypothetical protein